MLRIVKSVFFVVAVAFLAYFAWQSRELLVDILRTARLLHLGAAVLIWTLMNGVAAIFSVQVFRARGVSMSYATAARIHVANLPARYVPGGIWHTVGRAASFRELGISGGDIWIFIFLENVLAACVAFALGGCLLAATRGTDAWGQVAIACAFGGMAVLLLSPALLPRFAKTRDAVIPARSFLPLIIVTTVSWCIAATAFVTYVSAFPKIGAAQTPLEIAGGYLFSWGVGFVSIFAPQGIGIFEVVAAELLRGAEPLMGTAALLAGFRLVILVADVAAWSMLQLYSGLAIVQRRNLL